MGERVRQNNHVLKSDIFCPLQITQTTLYYIHNQQQGNNMKTRKIERKTLIDLGYSKYWSIIYTDGSYEHIPVIENKIKRT
jgi:hypothetical protein